ncbi:GDSL-type esterase/lipase family protein [Pedobacter aquatilis]|uniref:GDSL-type esterase/lipase family protein n=1 Tax=Pedobacter aquatilis TaxID=351343 RepID=UPI00292E10BF|nr:GDSL-type esterase/lipase family protein [Pedobacter aquatilis]
MNQFFKVFTLLLLSAVSSAYAQKTRIACIGNSVTAGYLLAEPESQSYPARLQQLLGNGFEVANFGFSGATLLKKGHRPYYKTTAFKNAISYKADVAFIDLGLNDTDPRNWPNFKQDFKKDYGWLIDTLRQTSPKIKIYICAMSPVFSDHPRFKSGTRIWYKQIQQAIAALADAYHLPLIDLQEALQMHPDLFTDSLHPDAEGASLIAKTIYEHYTGNFGGLKLSGIFGDDMVLQRDKPLPVYGTANAGEVVSVRFKGFTRSTKTGSNGHWKIYLPATKAGGPYQLSISSTGKTIQLKNVLFGDVWLCAGQSNMAFALKDASTGPADLVRLKKEQHLRLLNYQPLVETANNAWDSLSLKSVNRLNYFSGKWTRPDAASAGNFSAIGYYFGERLLKSEKVPIGLIQLAVGGSGIESWLDRETMEADPLLVDMLSNWRASDFLQDWVRERAGLNLKNAKAKKQRHPYEPCYNDEAGIAKIAEFPIKGVIWYQGESNTHNPELYAHEFPLLVNSWRKKWGKTLPFYFVQLSSIDRSSWPYFRDMQRKLAAEIPGVAMAVSLDLGDSLNVHPKAKKQIGERLVLLALANSYDKKLESTGPLISQAKMSPGKITLHFSHARQLATRNGERLIGFELEDNKGTRYPASGKIIGSTIVLTIPKQLKITKVLYAFAPFSRANLINQAGLPASTFSISLNP